MRKVLTLGLALVMVLTLAACSSNDNDGSNINGGVTVGNNSSNEQAGTTDESNKGNNQDSTMDDESSDIAEDVRIKLTFDNEEVIVNMYDNPTSKDFLGRLPQTLTFEDYAGTEKISYLEKSLSTEDAPSGSDPSVGDFAYYSPWGNVIFYYKDFHYSDGLIKLGKIESGIEKLANISSDFTVTIERIE
ncbi:cyclophilin-like fold protein [Paenibacillus sp. LPE1-1-1.1]|uniref:cyclophilin-like fold protein n=1 Tax=Paenibacillus sp. LPE1-1-1.1 TaxID=3135230 RepID=UPI00343EF253